MNKQEKISINGVPETSIVNYYGRSHSLRNYRLFICIWSQEALEAVTKFS